VFDRDAAKLLLFSCPGPGSMFILLTRYTLHPEKFGDYRSPTREGIGKDSQGLAWLCHCGTAAPGDVSDWTRVKTSSPNARSVPRPDAMYNKFASTGIDCEVQQVSGSEHASGRTNNADRRSNEVINGRKCYRSRICIMKVKPIAHARHDGRRGQSGFGVSPPEQVCQAVNR
jgi:hypothetical protein